jgi:hypothetical protein
VVGMNIRCLLMTLASTSWPLHSQAQAVQPSTALTDYQHSRQELESLRTTLAKGYDKASDSEKSLITQEAARVLTAALRTKLFPAWFGTPWDFSGISKHPGDGQIACGYFVSTLLLHAGFKVERYKLAQQSAERIVKTLVKAEPLRFRNTGRASVLSAASKTGEAIWVVGLDNHVGFLVYAKGQLQFCHSSYIEPAVVKCSNPATDPAFASDYYVLGQLFQADMIDAWLLQSNLHVSDLR